MDGLQMVAAADGLMEDKIEIVYSGIGARELVSGVIEQVVKLARFRITDAAGTPSPGECDVTYRRQIPE